MSLPGKESDNGVVEFQFYRPETETKWQSFRKAIYDPSTKRVLGRTGKSWGQLLLFYTIFYVVLAALFFVCMRVLFSTLDKREPTWTLEESLIGVNPGLGYRPRSLDTQEGSLIVYNVTNQTSSDKWVNLIDKFLKPYRQAQTGQNFKKCDYNIYPKEGDVCTVALDHLGNCTSDRKYGYDSMSPCVFLKLNKIFGWKPEYYSSEVSNMPFDLQQHINESYNSSIERQQVWVSCNGLDDADDEFIAGFHYYPRGFAGYYYPYKNDPNYLSPIIAVQVHIRKPNVIAFIECRAWARNIHYQGGSLNREGSVTFEIQVDS